MAVLIADEVRAEIDSLGTAAIAPGLSALAIELAVTFDQNDAPSARAMVADKLQAALVKLRALAPVQSEGDALDELTARRARRRGA